jgi:hypothetical protein
MKKLWLAGALGVLSFLTAAPARAQIFTPIRPNPFGGPIGSSPNYSPFRIPFRGSSVYPINPNVYSTQVIVTNTGQQTAADTTALTTGHATRFQYFSQYFMNQGGGTTPTYPNPFAMDTTGVPGPFGLGATGGVISPRIILGVQPRPINR